MMSSVIRQEIWLFLLSVLHGASLALFYDLFRSLRRAIPHGIVLLSLDDSRFSHLLPCFFRNGRGDPGLRCGRDFSGRFFLS